LNRTISPQSEKLLGRLPLLVSSELRAAFMADAERYPVLDYFRKHTETGVARANGSLGRLVRSGNNRTLELLYEQPASHKMLEVCYGKDAGDCGTVDGLLHESPCGQALRARLAAVISHTDRMVRGLFDSRRTGPVLIANLGSGPGRDTTAMLASLDGVKKDGGG